MHRLSLIARAQVIRLTALWPVLTLHLALGVVFLCLALAFAALTGRYGGATWLLAWPAHSLVVVGLGYLWLGPEVLGKQPDGTLSWKSALTLMPYFGAAELAWYVVRVLGDEEPWHEVAPGLYLGRRVQHWELPPRVAVVLDLTAEFVEPPELRSGRTYVCVPALDASVPSPDTLAAAIARVATHAGNVYVHCAAGHGRSAMAMAVLLVARGVAGNIDEAIVLMQQKRPRVRLRTTQRVVALATVELLRRRGSLLSA